MSDARSRAILDFWFLPPADPGHDRYRPDWFHPDVAFSTALRQRFASAVDAALAAGSADSAAAVHSTDAAAAALATLLLLGPFAHILYHGTPRAFAGVAPALALAGALVSSGRDKNLPPLRRWFVCQAFLHSEDRIDQERAVALGAGLRREAQAPFFDSAYAYALHQRALIERFGRFPQRNAALGRASTAAESDFLQQPNTPF